jgi:response regulator NasT
VLPASAPPALLDATVRLAAARARELAAARADAAGARRQLEERKLIERAKGILMRRTGTTEAEAYRILQRSSQDKATPMVTLAQAVLDSEPGAATHA